MPPRNVVLIGFSGSGKSAVAAVLAGRLGYVAVDTDAIVERDAGRTVASIFERDGEAAFRDREAAAVLDAVAGERRVIACGGGAILQLRNVASLQSAGTIVYLRTSPATILARLGAASDRPLLKRDPETDVPVLLAARAPAYESAADVIVDTDGRTPDEIADHIESLLKEQE